jgi:ABC-2 type transport system ATP-binding protein
VAHDATAAASAIRDLFEQRGLTLGRLEHIQPSLEDVFVSLIEASDRSSDAQSEVER